MYHQWKPYVPVAKRRIQAARDMKKLLKKGQKAAPIVIEGREIATTFWGKAWCDNLERYRDFENRLPRGRTYVRNGSVVDLVIAPGKVTSRVSGSTLYQIVIEITPLARAKWRALVKACSGAIDSVVELLQGRFAKGVMERLCDRDKGLFPAPGEIKFSCSCPDWASMCKHVAATLYGIGARLDRAPEIFFTLRQVDEKDLIANATDLALPADVASPDRVLDSSNLSAIFDVDVAAPSKTPSRVRAKKPRPRQSEKKTSRRARSRGTPG